VLGKGRRKSAKVQQRPLIWRRADSRLLPNVQAPRRAAAPEAMTRLGTDSSWIRNKHEELAASPIMGLTPRGVRAFPWQETPRPVRNASRVNRGVEGQRRVWSAGVMALIEKNVPCPSYSHIPRDSTKLLRSWRLHWHQSVVPSFQATIACNHSPLSPKFAAVS